MDDFELERDLEDAGIDAFDFSLMDEDERREALEDAFLDPDMYMDADLSSSFHAWEQLQSAGLHLSDLDFLDEDERREKLESAGLDPDDYDDGSSYFFHSAPVSSPPVQPSPAPHPESVKKEDTHVPPEPREVFRYLLVRFSAVGRSYAYRTDDRTISAGAQVMVPVGEDNAPVLAQVISAGDYAAEVAPYPPEKTKTILRRATEDDLSAHKQRKPAEKPAAPSVSRSTQSPASPPEEAHIKEEPLKEEDNEDEVKVLRSRSRLLVVIVILLAIIAVMLGGLVLYLMQNPDAAGNAATLIGHRKTESTEAPIQTKTPSPTRTPVPTPSPTPSPEPKRQMGDDETYDMILDVLDRLNAPSAYLSDYNERIWLPDSVAMDVEDIQEEERIWSGYRDNLQTVLDDLNSVTPSATFKKSWEDLYAYTSHLAAAANYLSDWDTNDDGVYSNEEDTDANQNALNIALLGQTDMEEMETDFTAALAEYEAKLSATPTPRPTVRPTPRPTATPRRTTPKPTTNSDPFHASDYAHPDDFYYDYYDDFWDYEDAEDYWEEYGDW